MPRRTARPTAPRTPARIRLPLAAYLGPALMLVCTLPLATAGGWWALAYGLPAIAAVLVIYAGTTATSEFLAARWIHGRTRIPWDDLDRLEFPAQRWARAVTHSGVRVMLPGVRPADLPRMVEAAGGRLFVARQSPGTAGAAPADTAGTAPVEAPGVPGSDDRGGSDTRGGSHDGGGSSSHDEVPGTGDAQPRVAAQTESSPS